MRTYRADDGTLDVLNITAEDAAELIRVFTTGKRSTAAGLPAFLVELHELAQRPTVIDEVVLDDQEVSTRAAADALDVEPRQVRKLCKAKKLRARKFDGGDWLIDPESLAQYLAQQLASAN